MHWAKGAIITILALWMVYLLSSMLTIVFTANMISGEVEAGTFAILVPKPLTRADIVVGKWLGYAAHCVRLHRADVSGVSRRHPLADWLLAERRSAPRSVLLELGMLALLGITTLGSSLVPTVVNGAIALMLFVAAPMASIVQFVVQILNPTSAPTVQSISTVISLVIPTDALWHGAAFFLLPPTASFITLGISAGNFNTPFTSGQPVAPALLVWAILYCIVLPVLAAVRFQHRDL